MIAALRCAGVRDSVGGAGIVNSSASNGIAAASDAARSANKAPSFSIRALGKSAAAKRAARPRCWITG